MLQMPNGTLFALAIQQDDTGATEHEKMLGGYEEVVTTDADFSYFPLLEVGVAPVKLSDVLPDEIGGRALPSGVFATGVWGGGPATFIARLDNRIGWPLLAAFGAVTTTADTMIENHPDLGGTAGSDTGIHTHKFTFPATNQYFLPWVTMRRMLPHIIPEERIGEVLQDGRLNSFTLNAAAAQPVAVSLNTLARVHQSNYVFNANPAWGTVTYDDFNSYAVTSCDGFVRVGGVDFKAVGVSLALANQLLQPQQSLHIGTIHPLDFPCTKRVMQVTTTFFVEDYDLYTSMFAGQAVDVYADPTSTSSNVGCEIYRADLDVMLASQDYITGTEPHRIRVRSDHAGGDNVSWTLRTLALAPNQPVLMQVIGIVEAVPTGNPIQVYLQNDQANYNLPV